MGRIKVEGNFDDALTKLYEAHEELVSARDYVTAAKNISSSYPTVYSPGKDGSDCWLPASEVYSTEYSNYTSAISSVRNIDFASPVTESTNLKNNLGSIQTELSAFNDYIADRGSATSFLEDLGSVGDGTAAKMFSLSVGEDGSKSLSFSPPGGGSVSVDAAAEKPSGRVLNGSQTPGSAGVNGMSDNDRTGKVTQGINSDDVNGYVDRIDDYTLETHVDNQFGSSVTDGTNNYGNEDTSGGNTVDYGGNNPYGPYGTSGYDDPSNRVTGDEHSSDYGNDTQSDSDSGVLDPFDEKKGKYGTDDKDDGSDDRVRNGEDPHLYGEDDAEEEYEKENGEGSLKQDGEKFGKNIDNEYDKQALQDYNDYDAAVKAAGIMAAFNEANDLFDNNTALLATKLSNMGYTEAEISQIMQNRDLTIRAFTENQKNQELANISENIAHKNGDTSFKSGYRNRKIDLNIENGKDAKAEEELNENVDNKNGRASEYSKKSSDDIDDLFAKAKNESVGMNSPDSLFKEESQVLNPNVVAEIIDTNAITADVGNKNVLDINGFINPKGGTGSILLNSLPIDLISVGVALAIKGASKLINGDKNEKLMINYDELAKYKYEKLDPKEIEQENERVMNEIESLYDNKEELSNRLKSFGYNNLDINTMLVDNDLARKAILDGTRRFKLAELAKGLAEEDGIKDYKSSYIRDVTLADLNNGNAESLCVNLSLDADFNKLREEYFTLERDFVNSANKANDDLAILNEAKGKFNKFITEHGDDTGSWTNEEYKEYEDLNKVSIDANRLFEQSNGRFNEIQATFMDIKNKYDSEKKSKIKEKINPLDLKQLMNA